MVMPFTRSNNFSNSTGFSLIELMVTVAIAAILMMVALPSLRSIVLGNQIQAASSEFQSALALARAEAIKRGGDARVTIVANTGTASAPIWTSGATVFYDTTNNANGSVPPTDASKLLMQTSPMATAVTGTTNFSSLTYNGFGRTVSASGGLAGGTAAFGSADYGWRCVIVSLQGRSRTVVMSNADYAAVGGGCPTN